MSLSRIGAVCAVAGVCLVAGATVAVGDDRDGRATRDGGEGRLSPAAAAFTGVDRTDRWELVDRIPLDFETHHTQGFALVGDLVFLSSVEILERPVKYPSPVDGYDRTTGRGVGHVFVLTRDGELLRDIEVGEGTVYHPGGIDHDGESVWVPVAEYRPGSRSIVYEIDVDTLRVTEAFRHDDHVGGVVRDRDTGRVHGVSWGSRSFFSWSKRGRLLGTAANPSHLVDYQDCDYAGDGKQLCSGITGLPTADGGSYELGGLALTDLADGDIEHEVPFPYFSSAGHVATRNPVALEKDGAVLRLLAAPDDGDEGNGTEILVYETAVVP